MRKEFLIGARSSTATRFDALSDSFDVQTSISDGGKKIGQKSEVQATIKIPEEQ
jgi:hypothetical protein